jgi:sugar/nucleoside kinase (ribokinase family)
LDILLVGSIALDSIYTPQGEVHEVLGGSASYFCAAARYFARTRVVAIVGQDFSRENLEWFHTIGASTEGISISSGKTFRWGGEYGKDPNRRDTLYTDLNVFESFHPEIPEKWKGSDTVFLANIDPDLQLEVLSQVRSPQLIIGDTMNLWIHSKKKSLMDLISRLHVLIINDEEIVELTDEPNILRGAREILKMGPKTVVVKKGCHGAVLVSKDKVFSVPAYPLWQVVDPTGAGDSFAGGFVSFLSSRDEDDERNVNNAVVMGTIIASFCCEDFGVNRLTTLTADELFARLEEFKTTTSFDFSYIKYNTLLST